MESLARLEGRTVGLDTAPLIHFIEDHPVYAPRLAALFEAAEQQRLRLVASVIVLAEILVHPLRQGQFDLVDEYRDILLNSPGLQTTAVSAEIAERAAELRARHNFRTPDAIHLATAVSAGATTFLTNDARLRNVPGLEILLLSELQDA